MSEYPKMLYRAGGTLEDHKLQDVPLKIMNKYECDTLIVQDAQEEMDALADGWTVSPDPTVQSAAQVTASLVSEKDAEIALLRAELEEAKRKRGGRPPRVDQPDLEPVMEASDGEQG